MPQLEAPFERKIHPVDIAGNRSGGRVVAEVAIVGKVKRERQSRDVNSEYQLVVAKHRNDRLIEAAVLRATALEGSELVDRAVANDQIKVRTPRTVRHRRPARVDIDGVERDSESRRIR